MSRSEEPADEAIGLPEEANRVLQGMIARLGIGLGDGATAPSHRATPTPPEAPGATTRSTSRHTLALAGPAPDAATPEAAVLVGPAKAMAPVAKVPEPSGRAAGEAEAGRTGTPAPGTTAVRGVEGFEGTSRREAPPEDTVGTSDAMVDWGGADDALSRFNVLDPTIVPPPGEGRRHYLRVVAEVLTDGVGGDEGVRAKASRTIAALAEVAVARAEAARRGRGDLDGASPGSAEVATMPALADWVADRLAGAGAGRGDPDEVARETGRALAEALEELSGIEPGATRRGRTALLALGADRRNGDVLATVCEALEPFRDEAVRRNTEASDFGPGNFEAVGKDGRTFRVRVVRGPGSAATLTRMMRVALAMALSAGEDESYEVVTSERGPTGRRRIAEVG